MVKEGEASVRLADLIWSGCLIDAQSVIEQIGLICLLLRVKVQDRVIHGQSRSRRTFHDVSVLIGPGANHLGGTRYAYSVIFPFNIFSSPCIHTSPCFALFALPPALLVSYLCHSADARLR